MQKIESFQAEGFWLVTGAAVIWGTIGVATQAIYNIDSTSSLFINLARMLVATPLLLLLAWRVLGRRLFHVEKRDWILMGLQGSLLVLSHAAYFASIRLTGVSIATLITLCLAPVIVSSVSVLFRLERMSKKLGMALVLAIAGTLLLVGWDSPSNQDNLLLGTIFALLAALSYGSSIVFARMLAPKYHPLQVTSLSFTVGTIVLLLINLGTGLVIAQTAEGWLLLLYLGLVPTALAYCLFQMGLRSVSATAASILSIIDPLVAALLAWGLFGETLAATGIIGAALLILSIFLLSMEGKTA